MFEELVKALTERSVDFEVVEGLFTLPTLVVFSRTGEQTTVQVLDGEIWIWGVKGRPLETVSGAAWTLSVIAAIC